MKDDGRDALCYVSWIKIMHCGNIECGEEEAANV